MLSYVMLNPSTLLRTGCVKHLASKQSCSSQILWLRLRRHPELAEGMTEAHMGKALSLDKTGNRKSKEFSTFFNSGLKKRVVFLLDGERTDVSHFSA